VHRDQQALKVQQDFKDVREYRVQLAHRDLKALQLLVSKVQRVFRVQQDFKDVREYRVQLAHRDLRV
jgi:hypothetical protein